MNGIDILFDRKFFISSDHHHFMMIVNINSMDIENHIGCFSVRRIDFIMMFAV